MLTEKDIQHIAKLARIKLTKQEVEKFKKEISSVLDYIGQLNRVSTGEINPLYQTTGLVNSTRSDEYREEFKMDQKLNEKLIDQAPDKENRFIKVKTVIQK